MQLINSENHARCFAPFGDPRGARCSAIFVRGPAIISSDRRRTDRCKYLGSEVRACPVLPRRRTRLRHGAFIVHADTATAAMTAAAIARCLFPLFLFGRNSSTRRPQGSTPMLGGGSCVMRVGAEMWWHVSGGRVMAGVQVGARARRPVARRRLKEAAGNGNRDGRRRRRHQVQLGVSVTGHEQLALVLVSRRVGRCRLRRSRQTLEVELVRVPLAVHLRHDVLVVVVPASIPTRPSNLLPAPQPARLCNFSFKRHQLGSIEGSQGTTR